MISVRLLKQRMKKAAEFGSKRRAVFETQGCFELEAPCGLSSDRSCLSEQRKTRFVANLTAAYCKRTQTNENKPTNVEILQSSSQKKKQNKSPPEKQSIVFYVGSDIITRILQNAECRFPPDTLLPPRATSSSQEITAGSLKSFHVLLDCEFIQ